MIAVPLTRGYEAFIDPDDMELVAGYKWRVMLTAGKAYAVAHIPKSDKNILLHRLIMNPPDGVEVDHRDGDGLDCTRANMRPCSHLENMRNSKLHKNNTSGYKGVSFDTRRQKWIADIAIGGGHAGHTRLGYFKSAKAAYAAYVAAANKYHGEFANHGD